mgnify:CR=1 FL=1
MVQNVLCRSNGNDSMRECEYGNGGFGESWRLIENREHRYDKSDYYFLTLFSYGINSMKKLSLIALVLALVSCQEKSAYVFSYFDTIRRPGYALRTATTAITGLP